MPYKPKTSDRAVTAATGHDWSHWFRRLDGWGAKNRSHKEIASYLHRIPFDALKIDRSFICHPGSDESTVPIVRTIMRLASDLGVEVVAEGVDTREQAEWLKSLGCQYGQGYLYAKPVDPADATKLLQAQPEPSTGRANP